MRTKVLPIIKDCNRQVVEAILKGYKFKMPYSLGSIFFELLKRNFKKNFLNHKASYALRNELIAQGIQTKTKEHMDGEPWFIFYTSDTYPFLKWSKKVAMFRKKTLYAFTPTDTIAEEVYVRMNRDKLLPLTLTKNAQK